MYIAIDQYNHVFHIKKHPRKELMEQLSATHVEKIYQDTAGGEVKHVGYGMNGLWLQVYKLEEWNGVEHENSHATI